MQSVSQGRVCLDSYTCCHTQTETVNQPRFLHPQSVYASRAEDPGFESPLKPRFFPGSSHTSDLKTGTPVPTLPGAWCYRVSDGTGRLGDWVRWKVWSATSIPERQHVKLSEQIRPWDTLACCWDDKQLTNKQLPRPSPRVTLYRHRHRPVPARTFSRQAPGGEATREHIVQVTDITRPGQSEERSSCLPLSRRKSYHLATKPTSQSTDLFTSSAWRVSR